METFSALLALCEGKSTVIGGLHSQMPVTRSLDIYFDLCMEKKSRYAGDLKYFTKHISYQDYTEYNHSYYPFVP